MRFVLELEVKAIIHVLDVKAFFGCIVLNDELLEEKESPLVVNPLTNLHLGDPQVGCVCLFTITALLVCNDKLYDEALLEECSIEYFLLHSELHFNTL
jgi:hypothetical protein